MPTSVRALTWLDLAICASFALPGVSALTFVGLDALSGALGLGPIEAPSGPAAFFVNLAGLFGVLWNVAMLQTLTAPLHRVDLVARFGVIGLIVFHVAASGLSSLFLAFVATESVGGSAKLRWLSSENARVADEGASVA